MIYLYENNTMYAAFECLKDIAEKNHREKRKTIVFCEDRLTLAVERAICDRVGGSFYFAVHTFSRFMKKYSNEKYSNILSAEASAQVCRRVIEENREKLQYFQKLYSASSARVVYDTIALLYSSRVDIETLKRSASQNTMLAKKMNDIALLYEKYFEYLSLHGKEDRNRYLKMMPQVLKNAPCGDVDILIFGFTTFTQSTMECMTACVEKGVNTYGIFIGGEQDFYLHEGAERFKLCCKNRPYIVCKPNIKEPCTQAKILLNSLFNPIKPNGRIFDKAISVYECNDFVDEMEYVAIQIKKLIHCGTRLKDISIMMPSPQNERAKIERILGEHEIPFYIDGGSPSISHPLAQFILDLVICVKDGCLPESVCAVVANAYFSASNKDKDIFRNYILRFCGGRGSIFVEPKKDVCEKEHFNYEKVMQVRKTFLELVNLWLSAKTGVDFYEAARKTFVKVDVENSSKKFAKTYANTYPLVESVYKKACVDIFSVIEDAKNVVENDEISANEYLQMLKAGFANKTITIIQPRMDAVYIGDICKNIATPCEVLFAMKMTSDVPGVTNDAGLLTDREIDILDELKITVAPKISRVNARTRERVALNMCSFSRLLYLTYSLGGDKEKSEIVNTICDTFEYGVGIDEEYDRTSKFSKRQICRSLIEHVCSSPTPALRFMYAEDDTYSRLIVKRLLTEKGVEHYNTIRSDIGKNCAGVEIFAPNGTIAPTTLEGWFNCPFKAYVEKGLKVKNRETLSSTKSLAFGNLVHDTLKEISKNIASSSENDAVVLAHSTMGKLLETPEYSPLVSDEQGKYFIHIISGELEKATRCIYKGLQKGTFKIVDTEKDLTLPLTQEITLFGRCDRIDRSGELVRIVDYKTGHYKFKDDEYEKGKKIQAELYLQAVLNDENYRDCEGVGAHYFIINDGFKIKEDQAYLYDGLTLKREDVAKALDINCVCNDKGDFTVDGVRKHNIEDGKFEITIEASLEISKRAISDMESGEMAPTPFKGACNSCAYNAMCRYDLKDGERK